jgi:hypothetical protein
MLKPNDVVLCIDARSRYPNQVKPNIEEGQTYTIDWVSTCCQPRVTLKGKTFLKGTCKCGEDVSGLHPDRFIKLAGPDIEKEIEEETCLDFTKQKTDQKNASTNDSQRSKEKVSP